MNLLDLPSRALRPFKLVSLLAPRPLQGSLNPKPYPPLTSSLTLSLLKLRAWSSTLADDQMALPSVGPCRWALGGEWKRTWKPLCFSMV